ncbi:MAG: hypothetical protein ACK5PQ_03015 [Alphaproteobacteria bacterium]
MEAVHDYGRRSGCSMATVATMSFQWGEFFLSNFRRSAGFPNAFIVG